MTAVEIGCLEQFDGKARNKVELDRDSNELMTDYPTRDSHEANITTITSLHQLPILSEVTMDTPRKVMFTGKSL